MIQFDYWIGSYSSLYLCTYIFFVLWNPIRGRANVGWHIERQWQCKKKKVWNISIWHYEFFKRNLPFAVVEDLIWWVVIFETEVFVVDLLLKDTNRWKRLKFSHGMQIILERILISWHSKSCVCSWIGK